MNKKRTFGGKLKRHEIKFLWTKQYFSMLEYVIGHNMKLHKYSQHFSKLMFKFFEHRSKSDIFQYNIGLGRYCDNLFDRGRSGATY